MRRLLLVAVLVVAGCGGVPSRAGSTPAMSDAAIQAAMVEALANFPESTAAIPRNAAGVPDIAYRDGVLFVATTSPGTAASLCRTVAGMTHNPDTGKPLGILAVVVIAGGDQLAKCKPS